jgi:hypothetical protein
MLKELEATSKTQQRVDRLLDRQNTVMRRQFFAFVDRLTAKPVMEAITTLARASNIEAISRIVDGHIGRLANVLGEMYLAAADAEADALVTKASYAFDVSDPEVARQLRVNRLNFIQNLTAQQREVVRESLIRGIRAGESAEQMARRFRNTVGLTNQQRLAVENYQRNLEQGSAAALQRVLRPTQYDVQVERAIDENDVLTPTQIQRMVGAYTRNLLQARAEAIANTESLRMVSQGRDAAVRQSMQRAGVGTSRGKKTWLVTSSLEPRDNHLGLVGQTVGIDEPFISPNGTQFMYPGDTSLGAGASEIVNCKCGIEYTVEE